MARITAAFCSFCVFSGVIVILINYLPNSNVHVHIHILRNGSQYKNDSQKVNLLVINTTNCKIPKFSPFDPGINIKKIKPLKDTCERSHGWSYMDGNELFISSKNMKRDGHLYYRISCCYKGILRIVQQKHKYNPSEVRNVSVEHTHSNCIPISKVRTRISKELIMVECSKAPKQRGDFTPYTESFEVTQLLNVTELSESQVLYRGYHAIPQMGHSVKTHDKMRYWINKPRKLKDRLPNILVIGLDSTSSINVRRPMSKTRQLLRHLGAAEMLGYTKVAAEKTFPNYCPILFGYSERDLKHICYYDKSTKMDDCPSIYKRLDDAKYLTAHTEDIPVLGGFNHQKTGFVERHVDFYPRTLFLSSKNHKHEHCVGHQTSDEAISSYIQSILDVAAKYQTPIFSFSWSSKISQDDFNSKKLSDGVYSKLLHKLELNGHLDNTILIFVGDHGYRVGTVRKTPLGYYEDQVPNMWIRLPQRIKKEFPEWLDALKVNSRRLTSPFTLYWTLNFILDTFTNTSSPTNFIDYNKKELVHREDQRNFFDLIPEVNTCMSVGIPEEYCPCFPIYAENLKDSILIEAASASILKINQELIVGSKCSLFKLDKITGGNKTTIREDNAILKYRLTFTTFPGQFLFQAEINYFSQNQTFSENFKVQRASKINKRDLNCIKDSNLEQYCYCD